MTTPIQTPNDTDQDGLLDVNEAAAGTVIGVRDHPAVQLEVTLPVN